MKKNNNNAVILFARDPVLGQVKTRLSFSLDNKTILGLYICFVEDSLEKIRRVDNADCFVGVFPRNHSSFFNETVGSGIKIFAQQGNDLG